MGNSPIDHGEEPAFGGILGRLNRQVKGHTGARLNFRSRPGVVGWSWEVAMRDHYLRVASRLSLPNRIALLRSRKPQWRRCGGL